MKVQRLDPGVLSSPTNHPTFLLLLQLLALCFPWDLASLWHTQIIIIIIINIKAAFL